MIVIIIVLTIVIVVIVVVIFILIVVVNIVLLPVLSCEFGFHLVDCTTFKFLTHRFFFLLPVELPLMCIALSSSVVVFAGWRHV